LLAEIKLLVDLAPMRDPGYIHGLGRVVNLVYEAVIADPNPPFVMAALELFAARRALTAASRSRRVTIRAIAFAGSERNSLSALAAKATR
jgi:hypothetical protein